MTTHRFQAERESLQRKVGVQGLNYLSDLRTAMFGSNRSSEIRAQLGGSVYPSDNLAQFINESSGGSSPTSPVRLRGELQLIHEGGSYLLPKIKTMSGLVAYWPLNETSLPARDISVNGLSAGEAAGVQGGVRKNRPIVTP